MEGSPERSWRGPGNKARGPGHPHLASVVGMSRLSPMPEPLQTPVLAGGVVTLRPHTMADLRPVLERCLDPESVRWTTVPTGYTEDMARDYLEKIIEPSAEQISWAIEADGQYAGTIDLRSGGGEGEHASGDVGYVTHPRFRGRGIMTAAVTLAVDHAFDVLGWELLVWQANIGNVASYKPMWRNGFPRPLSVPALLNHRGVMRDGWHSVLEPGMPREPQGRWEDVSAALLRDVEQARRPG